MKKAALIGYPMGGSLGVTSPRHGGEPSPLSHCTAWSEPLMRQHDQHAATAAAPLRYHVARLCIRPAIGSPRIDLTGPIMTDLPHAVNGIYQRIAGPVGR